MKHAGYRREGIGSRFPLDLRSLVGPARHELRWPGDRSVALESGRSAILWLIDALGLGPGDRALLPAYVCDSAVAPFRLRGVELDFYRVGENLLPDGEDAAARLTPRTRVLMVIHYFGFPASPAALARMPRGENLVRLEDWVQGPLSAGALAEDGFGDYRVLAWHKVLPVPDSGLLLRAAGVPPPPRRPPLAPPRAAYAGRRLAAKGIKALAVGIAGGAPRGLYRGLFDAAEQAAGAGTRARMSRLSRRMLLRLPLAEVARRRRENFRRLAEALSGLRGLAFLRPDLPEGVCPLGLPIRVPNRDGVLARLLAARIYPPVHWPLPAEVDPAAFPGEAALAAGEMTLPVDQRYGAQEMDFIAGQLREALAPEGREGFEVSGGKLTLLGAEGADAARWTAALEGMPGADIYFTPAYTRLFCDIEGDEPIGALWESARGRALFPLQIRPLAQLPYWSSAWLGARADTPAYDATSPYGYSGPLAEAAAGQAPGLIREFTAALWEELRGRRVVSLFIRFHPLARNAEYFQVDGIDPALRSETVFTDLRGAWYKGLTSKCRYEVRKSDRRGAILEVSEDPGGWLAFGDLYRATMTRRRARKWYVFPQSFFEETRRLLGRGVFLLVAWHAGRIVAGSLFLEGFGKLHYHLSGSAPEAAGLGVTNRLIVEAARIGEARGCSALHLGGGLAPGDGLHKFKASFSPLRAVWDKACVVLDREAYADLEEGRREFLGARGDGTAEEISGKFPAYRHGLEPFMEDRDD